jgi:predicted HNH restriction endonuclease
MLVKCKCCEKEFNKFPKEVKKSPNHFCSRSCAAKINNKICPKRKKEGVCIYCDKPTPSSRKKCKECIERARLTRGAKRIATSVNSKRDRSYEKDLCLCGNKKEKRSQKCSLCISEDSLNKTKIEIEYSNVGNRASRWCRVREHARKVAAENGMSQKPCAKCGFSEHVQICHIKSISDFLDTDTVREINSITNLIQLCPNCHWLFDHGKISL